MNAPIHAESGGKTKSESGGKTKSFSGGPAPAAPAATAQPPNINGNTFFRIIRIMAFIGWLFQCFSLSKTSTQSCGDGTFFWKLTGLAAASPAVAVALMVP